MFFDYLIRFSIKNKFLILLFVLGIIGWGSYALLHIPIDALPDITNNQVQIITYCPNLAPQEIEQFVTSPIEIALASTPQLQEIRSLSRFGLSVITVVFEENVPIYLGRQWLTERLENAKRQIPPGLGAPELAPASTGLGEIYQYTLHVDSAFSGKYSLMQLRTYQDWIIKRRLLAVPGVAEISSFGGMVKQYEVALNPEKMKNYGISFTEVWETLQKNNENTGGAYIEKESHSYFIRGIGLLQTPQEIEQLTVKVAGGFPIRIAQIGRVREGSAIRYGALTENGREVCGGVVLMRKGENPAEVTQKIKKEVAEIQKSLPPGIKIQPFLDRIRLVDNAIHTVRNNLIEGGLIVIFVLVLLLGNLRAGIIVALCIPLSLLFALGMMYWLGISANLMSLGAIDFGLIVDGAVIMVESVLHHLQSLVKNGTKLIRGAELDNLVIEQARRIRKTAAFGELIIMIVYLPLLTLSGIEGKMFIPMALAVTFAIMGAFILSLTFVPMASAWALANISSESKFTLPEKIIAGVARFYLPALHLSLKFRWAFLGLITISFIATLHLFTTLGGQFIPTLEEGDLAMEMTILPGSSLQQSIRTTTAIEKLLLQHFPEVRGVVSKIGTSEIPTDPMAIERADIMILLKDKKDWVSASSREELVKKMEKVLSILPVVNFSFQQPIQMRFNELMTGTKTDIGVMIYGEDLDTLASLAQKIKNIANSIEGAADIYVERQTGLPQIAVNYYPEKLAQYGVSRQEVNFAIRSAFAGAAAGVIYEGEKKFDLVLRLDTSFRKSIRHIQELYITLPLPHSSGLTQVPLFELANVTYEQGPMQINRERGKRRVIVGVNVRGKDVESVIVALQKAIAEKIALPIGYHIAYGGEFENLKAAKARLQLALPLALALIFILLYFTLHSVKQTVIIFTAIPLAAIGGVWGLWLRDMPFSISAGVGFIALFGVAALNGIVLIGYFNQLETQGIPPLERIYQGVKVRLRPVLMTALVAALGFLPMAVSTSGGAEVQRPLATVVIAGLLSATVLTLFILPILYGSNPRRLQRKLV
jgi:cobalt-zinc-cadmium resistance protein CzcA